MAENDLTYIYQNPGWPHFLFKKEIITDLLAEVKFRQGRILGKMESLGFQDQNESTLENLSQTVLKSSEIEGELLNPDQVRSSIARQLGIPMAGAIPSDRHVDGVVEMLIDATTHFQLPLDENRLHGWHSSLFPTGYNGSQKIIVGSWRNDALGPMQVVSGSFGKEKIHYEAPPAKSLPNELSAFIMWFNQKPTYDYLLQAAIAHLWFVTLHPYDDGNGRIARAISDLLLARSDQSAQRYYSLSAQIQKERSSYYEILEATQKGTLDITRWIQWFLKSLLHALERSESELKEVLKKSAFWQRIRLFDLHPRQKKMLQLLLNDFEGKLTSQKWAQINKCSPDAALRDITDLIEKGILKRDPSGGRSTSYSLQNPPAFPHS